MSVIAIQIVMAAAWCWIGYQWGRERGRKVESYRLMQPRQREADATLVLIPAIAACYSTTTMDSGRPVRAAKATAKV